MSRLHCRIYFHPTCFRCSAIESDRRNELRIGLWQKNRPMENTNREERGCTVNNEISEALHSRFYSSFFLFFSYQTTFQFFIYFIKLLLETLHSQPSLIQFCEKIYLTTIAPRVCSIYSSLDEVTKLFCTKTEPLLGTFEIFDNYTVRMRKEKGI